MTGSSYDIAGFASALLAAFTTSVLITAWLRRYALHRSILDIPNERSSHSIPTPRGGGLAIAIAFALGVAMLGYSGMLSMKVVWALLGGGIMVAGIGWLDDHRHVAPRWRALVHMFAAAWALYCLGGFSSVTVGESALQLGWFGNLLALVGIVWLINLYNFMDGIDGLAGVEAVTAGVCGAALLWWTGAPGLAMAALLLAAASSGFLVWNWPPAKIFMGDVGSGLVGYCFAVLALAGENSHALPATAWLLLLAAFVMDATFTLIHRVMRGERWYTAHRSHAYQRCVQMGRSHLYVTVAVGAINLLILFPAAVTATVYPGLAPWCVAIIMVAAWLLWKTVQTYYRRAAGQSENSAS